MPFFAWILAQVPTTIFPLENGQNITVEEDFPQSGNKMIWC